MTHIIIGGTGKTGHRVAKKLATQGFSPRIGSRGGRPPFDWDTPSTWAPALEGMRCAYVAYPPDLAFPGAAEKIHAMAQEAVKAGVRRMVLLSGRGEEEVEPAEQAVRETVAEWTILRASWLNQNFSEHFLLAPVLAGVIALPTAANPDVAEPFVDAGDIADVAAVALTTDGHQGRTYELTGPRAVTFTEVAAVISRVSRRDVRYLPVTPAEFQAMLPPDLGELLTNLFVKVLDGRNSKPTNDIPDILGRPARDFTAYAESARKAW